MTLCWRDVGSGMIDNLCCSESRFSNVCGVGVRIAKDGVAQDLNHMDSGSGPILVTEAW